MYVKKFIFSFLFLITASSVCFSSVKNSGAIIKEKISARAASMGYAYAANTVDDAFGFLSNPAQIPSAPLAALAYSSAFKSGENISEETVYAFSFLYPALFSGINTGIAFIGSLEKNIASEQDYAAYLNFSKQIKFLKIGANAKYVNSGVYDKNGSGIISADAGVSASFGMLIVGAAGHNLFGAFKDVRGDEINPSWNAAASVEFNKGEFIFSFAAGGEQKNIEINKINPQAGFEVFYRFIAFRCGYEYDGDLKDKSIIFAGFGVETKYIIFDYAFTGEQNRSGAGDLHKASFAYRFYGPPKINNEQYMRQIEYEKRQAKEEKERLKRRKKEVKSVKDKPLKPGAAKKSAGSAVAANEYENEFAAVLLHEEVNELAEETPDEKDKAFFDAKEKKRKEKNKATVWVEDKEFDAAKYILKNPGKHKVKQHLYAPTKVGARDFDAARYILANPGQSKIKEYYFKPTKVSEGDFDAALYLIGKEEE